MSNVGKFKTLMNSDSICSLYIHVARCEIPNFLLEFLKIHKKNERLEFRRVVWSVRPRKVLKILDCGFCLIFDFGLRSWNYEFFIIMIKVSRNVLVITMVWEEYWNIKLTVKAFKERLRGEIGRKHTFDVGLFFSI